MVRQDIIAYIDRHYMEELSMKAVARAMNYSDAYFCKLFKQCFQVNFSTYLNEYRIRKACTMMENLRRNIKDIGVDCGYTDSNYFSRVFKRFTGQTPTEYRLSIMEKVMRN
jgi:YesN/AraC family two-component response regulator